MTTVDGRVRQEGVEQSLAHVLPPVEPLVDHEGLGELPEREQPNAPATTQRSTIPIAVPEK